MRSTSLFGILVTLFFSPILWAENITTQARFDHVIDDIIATNRNELLKHSPKGVTYLRHWDSNKMNGTAGNVDGLGKINLYGGVARHPLMTEDGFRAYVCHEIGHIAGGAPRFRARMPIYQNLSVECQADYHATNQCLKRVFAGKDNQAAIAKLTVPPIVKQKCEQTYSAPEDIAICIRSAMAGFSFINALSTHRAENDTTDHLAPPSLDFTKPDQVKVASTIDEYGSPQCRLDTLFQGALNGERPACWYNQGKKNKKGIPVKEEPEVAQ